MLYMGLDEALRVWLTMPDGARDGSIKNRVGPPKKLSKTKEPPDDRASA